MSFAFRSGTSPYPRYRGSNHGSFSGSYSNNYHFPSLWGSCGCVCSGTCGTFADRRGSFRQFRCNTRCGGRTVGCGNRGGGCCGGRR